MKVAVYIRVSTREQAQEGYSISAQRQRLQAYCESQGWDIIGYFADEGLSAKNTERPELQRMFSFIKDGLVDTVLVYKLDRLTRSVLDLYEMLKTFDKYNCKFKSATEVYDTTSAMGRMFITLVAALAQFERENLAERVSMGLSEKARQGKWTGSRTPFGYTLNNKKDLMIQPDEAKVVKWIFEAYSTLSTHKIAAKLNHDIMEGKNVAPRFAKYWTDAAVSYILRNPIYMGTGRWHYRTHKENYFEIEGMAPPIITKEQFEKAKKVRENRIGFHPRSAASPFAFSGIAKCSECGSGLIGHYTQGGKSKPGYTSRNYRCPKRKLGLCNGRGVAEKYLEAQFLNVIDSWNIDVEAKEDASEPLEQENHKEEIEELQKELERVEKRRKKWQYAWANESITDEDFTARMEEENQREQAYQEELYNLQPTSNKPVVHSRELEQGLRDLIANWEAMSLEERKDFLQTFVKSFTVKRVSNVRNPSCIEIHDFQLY